MMIRNIVFLLLLLSLVFAYTKPYVRPGFFSTHDGEWAVIRLAEMERELKDYQFPPRWAGYLNHEYGYPLFSFTYPFPYFLGMLFRAVDIGLVDTVKILFVLSVASSAVFCYLLCTKLFHEYAGFLVSILYITVPFRLVNLYIRGSLGESLSLAFFPLIFLCIFLYVQWPSLLRFLLASFVFAAFLLTHNVSALIFFPVAVVFAFCCAKMLKKDLFWFGWRYILPFFIVSIGLSAYFIFPALAEKSFIRLSRVPLSNVTDHFIEPAQFFASTWNFDGTPPFQLGIFHVLAAFLGVTVMKKKHAFLGICILAMLISFLFFTQRYSLFFWQFPPISFIDFPWRMITVISFLLCLLAGFSVLSRPTLLLGMGLAILSISTIQHAQPKDFHRKEDAYYATNDATTTSMDELLPIWVVDKPTNRFVEKVQIMEENAHISSLRYNSHAISFNVRAVIPTNIRVNTLYFPGWTFYLDGKRTVVDYGNRLGVMDLTISSGMHTVEGKFQETPLRAVANSITIGTLVSLFTLFIFSRFGKREMV